MLHGATTSPSACQQMTLCQGESQPDGGSRKAAVCQRVPVCCMRDRGGVCQISRLHCPGPCAQVARSFHLQCVAGRCRLDLDSSVLQPFGGGPTREVLGAFMGK